MKEQDNEFNEVEYFTDIAKLRYTISRMMYNHQLVEAINPSQGKLNPFHQRVDKNQRAVFGVEFLDDIVPYCLYTPYGAMEINPYEMKHLEVATRFLTQEQRDAFLSDMQKTFHMVEVQSCLMDDDKTFVKQPAIYGITKLPWKRQTFDQKFWIQKAPTNFKTPEFVAEREHVQNLRTKVNENLSSHNFTQAMFTDALPEKQHTHIETYTPASAAEICEAAKKHQQAEQLKNL